VGLALHACLGGSAPGFHVSQISHQVFKFALSCKQVGLFVYSLKSYSYDKFMVRFDLWRDGGANYRREFARWNRECLAEWTTVSHTRQPRTSNRVSFADKLIQDSPQIKHKPRNLSIKFGQFCRPMDFSSPQKNLVFVLLMFLLLGWRILQQANIRPVFFGGSGLPGLSKIQTLLMAALIALPTITR
jgi:hypothetical protein